MRFSQRIGKRPIKTTLQVESIDKDLENGLWNNILEDLLFKARDYAKTEERRTPREEIYLYLWTVFFKERVDRFYEEESAHKYLEEWFFSRSTWVDKYDLIEFLSNISDALDFDFTEKCNSTLKSEMSGYRIVEGNIVQITSNEEIEAIEEAISTTETYKSVNEHLRVALNFLSDRKSPDYRNSIKESISAVEAFCKIITLDEKATLGKALAVIEKKHNLHGSLKSAFNALYGYTSDAGGIRHAILKDDVEIGFEDAKFMLVTCSSFVNYLKAKINA